MKQRKHLVGLFGVGVGLVAASVGGGCGILGNLLSNDFITVDLVNETGFATDVRLYYGDNQNAFEFELTTFGEEFDAALAASGTGASRSFTRSCDDLQAIIIDNAESRVPLVSPNSDTEVYRDASDFSCGDVLTFRFVLEDSLIPDLRIVFSASPN